MIGPIIAGVQALTGAGATQGAGGLAQSAGNAITGVAQGLIGNAIGGLTKLFGG
jgi:hypothetical protein